MESLVNKEGTKFRVLESPREIPGVCQSCGSSRTDDRDYVDFGLTIDFLGVVYFCTFCFTECANTLGFLSVEQTILLEAKLNEAQTHVAEFRAKEKALDDAIFNLRDSGILDYYDRATSMAPEKPVEPISLVTTGDNQKSEPINQHSDEQTNKQGPTDVSTTRGDEFDVFEI